MDKNNSPLINIENLHIHMDERMDSMNFYNPEKDNSGCCCPGCDDEVEVDTEELVKEIQQETHLPMVIIERVLAAESKILAKMGVATEIHVEEDDEPDAEATAEDEAKTDAHKMVEKVFPAIAGLMLVSLLRNLSLIHI